MSTSEMNTASISSSITYHLIWCPRRRKPVLVGPVAARCRELIEGKCAEKGWEILALAIQPDHIHLFVRVWPSDSAAGVVKACKGMTSFHLRKEFPHLLKLPSTWTRNYFASTTGNVSQETIQRYIAAQTGRWDMETVRKTYQEKLKPTPAQERELERTLWRCRTLYNTALEQRITLWKQRGVSLTRSQQEAELKDLRAELPDYAALHSHVLQDVLARLDKTYQAFFRRVQNGEKPRAVGFPRFHGKDRYHSFTYKEYGNGARLDNGCLVLSKIGRIAVPWSRPIQGTIKTVTISKEADGWYVSFSCAEVPTEPLPLTGCETGIDVGLKVFLITADGDMVENPRHYRKAEKQLAKANKRISRRKKGSKRRKKAAHQCAKKHQHVRRQRQDFHHKTALALVRAYDVIYVEGIQPANLSRRPAPKPDENGNGGYEHTGASRKAGLNKSIHDAGWHQFLGILTFKAACAGKRVEAVNPAYTSQECSGCGEIVQKSLSVRTHVCTSCGLIIDRDENAAKNILWRGQRLRGVAGMPAALNREPVGL